MADRLDPAIILASVSRIPPMSPGVGQLLQLVGKGSYEMSAMVDALAGDSGLTANILKIVNSAAMGLRREVLSLAEAVAYLGETKVIGVALTSSGGSVFNTQLQGYSGNRGDLGRHCLWVAIAARELARKTHRRVDPAAAYTSALLHDIGKAVLSDYLAQQAKPHEAEVTTSEDPSHLQLEQRLLATDHCEVGSALAWHWQLPERLTTGIRYHHAPADAEEEDQPLAYVVHLADMLAMLQGVGTGMDDLQYELDDQYGQFLKISERDLEKVAMAVHQEFQATAEALFGRGSP